MNNVYALDQNGGIWNVGGPSWEPFVFPPLPVPVGEIKFWDPATVITKNNVLWKLDPQSQSGEWIDCGPWPGSEVPSAQETWGSVKGKYEGEE